MVGYSVATCGLLGVVIAHAPCSQYCWDLGRSAGLGGKGPYESASDESDRSDTASGRLRTHLSFLLRTGRVLFFFAIPFCSHLNTPYAKKLLIAPSTWTLVCVSCRATTIHSSQRRQTQAPRRNQKSHRSTSPCAILILHLYQSRDMQAFQKNGTTLAVPERPGRAPKRSV
jgi:hypothetical protein